jgi:hypothetical protein
MAHTDLELLRTHLRASWRRATPAASWVAPMSPTRAAELVAVAPDGTRTRLATFARAGDAELAVALREAVPALFAEVERPRSASRGLAIVGEVR